MNDVSDIRDALVQLDRRLGEIRQHVGRLLQDDEPSFSAAGVEFEAPAPTAAPEPSPPPDVSDLPAANEPQVSSSPEVSGPILSPSGVGDRDIADAQIQRLRELRAELMRGTRELVDSYERQLDALEATFTPASPQAPVFEGAVSLVVTNVSGIAALADVEAAVRRVDGVERAAVTRYAGQEASVEVDLAQPVELIGLLTEVLPGAAIRTSTSDEIVLELEAAEAG